MDWLPDMILAVLRAVWLTVPMLLPNSAAVLFGGGAPVDLGRTWKDGRRILGDGKTWRGLIGGTASGMLMGLVQWCIISLLDVPEWTFNVGFGRMLLILFLLAFGSMLGDMLGSFVKRRLDRPRGARVPILDQYDFFIGAMLLLVPLQWSWFRSNFLEGSYLAGFVGLVVLIPLMHRAVNIIGFKMGKKDVPW